MRATRLAIYPLLLFGLLFSGALPSAAGGVDFSVLNGSWKLVPELGKAMPGREGEYERNTLAFSASVDVFRLQGERGITVYAFSAVNGLLIAYQTASFAAGGNGAFTITTKYTPGADSRLEYTLEDKDTIIRRHWSGAYVYKRADDFRPSPDALKGLKPELRF